MKKDAEFHEFLTRTRKYSVKFASDVRSRCKRIERVFRVSLDAEVASEARFHKLLDRITAETHRYVRGTVTAVYAARGAHRLAAKLYYKFLNA